MKMLIPALIALSAAGAAQAQTVVPVPAFGSIELKSGGRVILRQGPQQRVTLVKGDLAYTRIEVRNHNAARWLGTDRGKLRIETCVRSCPKNYEMVVVVTSPQFPAVAVDSGGSIVAEGPFARQSTIAAAVDSGGSIDIRAIKAANVAAAVDSGGKIVTAPLRTLSAAVDDGGLVLYEGDPIVTSAVDGGGAVRKVADPR
jgi:hypothetical protein